MPLLFLMLHFTLPAAFAIDGNEDAKYCVEKLTTVTVSHTKALSQISGVVSTQHHVVRGEHIFGPVTIVSPEMSAQVAYRIRNAVDVAGPEQTVLARYFGHTDSTIHLTTGDLDEADILDVWIPHD